MSKLTSRFSLGLKGRVRVPGDKSISHRAIMLSALAVGESRVTGLLEGEDVLATAAAMRALGADIVRGSDGVWRIHGVGVGGLTSPSQPIDLGNSGTSARLLMGLLATHDLSAVMVGDASLSRRPMGRVTEPLSKMGGQFEAREGGRLPIHVRGTDTPLPLEYTVPVASAQVKSAILLAGLNTPGRTVVRESVATRDYTESMLAHMGADITVQPWGEGGTGREISVTGYSELAPVDVEVPGDISSAAFVLVAASIVPGSDVVIENVGLNPLRTGLLDVLLAMGADIKLVDERTIGGERAGDLHVRAAKLKGITSLPVHPSTLIDEFPVLFVAAACAEGESYFSGLEELRVKESDRLSAMAAVLLGAGVALEEGAESLRIQGRYTPSGKVVAGGNTAITHLDHRIAMSASILGMVSESGVHVDDASAINTSFPGYSTLMTSLGAVFEGG